LCSWCLWKALDEERRCMGFGSMTFGLAVQKFFLNLDWDMCRKAFGDIHLGIQSKEYPRRQVL
jgi:ribosomal protein L5